MNHERLLIVEDDRTMGALLREVATRAGYDVRWIHDSGVVETTYRQFQPHAIILDIVMPNQDGFDILRLLAEWHSTAHIILLSGSGYLNMACSMARQRGLRLYDALAKPLQVNRLETMLHALHTAIRGDSYIPLETNLPQLSTAKK